MQVSRITVAIQKPVYAFYDVPGTTWRAVKRNRFDVRRRLNIEYDALTTSTLHPSIEGSSLVVEMRTEIRFPRAPDGDAETQRYLRSLKCHEEWHFRSNAAILRKSAKNTPVPRTPAATWAFLEAVQARQDQANERYDTLTRHGCSLTSECGKFDCTLPH